MELIFHVMSSEASFWKDLSGAFSVQPMIKVSLFTPQIYFELDVLKDSDS